MVILLAKGTLQTRFGEFSEMLFYDGQSETIALVKGDVSRGNGVLCRVHSHCISAHIFNSIECDCREQMAMAQEIIEKRGKGIIIWLNQEGRGNGHMALLQSSKLRQEGMTQTDAYTILGYEADARSYKRVKDILDELKVESIELLSNSPGKESDLTKIGVKISLVHELFVDSEDNEYLRKTYIDKISLGHRIKVK